MFYKDDALQQKISSFISRKEHELRSSRAADRRQ